MRTRTLEPTAEQAIIDANGARLRGSPRDYTETLSELVYDTGLVIHNSTPGVVPRGFGANSDLRTFTGRFAGEETGSSTRWPVLVVLGAGAAGLAGALIGARRRRARTRPTVSP